MATKSWQEWVNENLHRGCEPQGIVDILRDNKFTPAAIRKLMGESYPEETEAASSAQATERTPDFNPVAQKLESLASIQRSLARLNPNIRNVERRRGVSGDEFLEKYYSANKPVILCDLMTYWDALKKWTPEYLKATCGEEIVEIQASRDTSQNYEIDDQPHRRNLPFAEYVDMVVNAKESNDYYLTARNNFFGRPAGKLLLKDIESFTEYLKKDNLADGAFLWYGPKGTVTPLHHDTMNIFLAQVEGRKHIKLVPSNELDLVYNHYAVYSQVDVANPDYNKFPKFRDAHVIDIELAPGEVLFIPAGWWHYVKSLDRSISISFINFLFPNEYKWANPQGGEAKSGY